MGIWKRMDKVCFEPIDFVLKIFQFFFVKRYSEDGQTAVSVDYPDEQVMVFDVETLVCEGNFPVLAVALSPNHWFVI